MAAMREQSYETQRVVDEFVYTWTGRRGGSISAEHGIGMLLLTFIWFLWKIVFHAYFGSRAGISKVLYLSLSKSADSIALMRRLKGVLDPNNIMNPYKIFADKL